MSEPPSRSSLVLGVMAALNPILVLLVGFFLDRQVRENTKQISDLREITTIKSLALQQQIDKSKVIATFLDQLSGPEGLKKKLAIQAILIVMPEEGVRFVEVVEKNDAASAPAIRQAINDRSAGLVEDLFSDSQAQRLAALSSLRKSFLDNPVTFGLLMTRGLEEIRARETQRGKISEQAEEPGQLPTAGLYNAVAFFGAARVPSDPNLKNQIRDFLMQVQQNGSPQTRALAAMTVKRFN
jgi:hypothetical protein